MTHFVVTVQNGRRVLVVEDKKARDLAEQLLFVLERIKEYVLKG